MKYIFVFFIVSLSMFAVWKIFTSAAIDRFLSNLSKKSSAVNIQEEFNSANSRAKNYERDLKKTQAQIDAEAKRLVKLKK